MPINILDNNNYNDRENWSKEGLSNSAALVHTELKSETYNIGDFKQCEDGDNRV